MVPGQDEAKLQLKKLLPLSSAPAGNNQGGTPAGDNYHIWMPVGTMHSWRHLMLPEMTEPLYLFRQHDQPLDPNEKKLRKEC